MASLYAKASRALGWSFLNTVVGRLGTLAIGIALARLLGPHEFGVFAVALVALLAVLSFNELGVSLAIVRWPGDPRAIAPTVATISAVSSALVYLGCYLAAPAFTAAMGAPAATPVVRLLTLSVLVDGVTAVPHALMQREFRQGHKMIADQVGSWGGTLLSIGLALTGMGAMSLAVGRLAGSVATGALFVAFSPQPLRFGFDPAKARALLKFGTPLAGSSLVVFAVANVDQLIVGDVLGPTALGFFVLAFNLSNWPVGMFSQPVRSVAPAAFARLQHDPPAMRGAFLSLAGLLAGITLPVCLLLSGAAQPLVRFVYGADWAPASTALFWLAVLGGFRILFELVYDYFVVLGRSRAVFTVQLGWLVALVPALIAGARLDGLAGVGVAHVLVAALVVLPCYLWELHRAGIGAGAFAARVGPPVLIAALVGAAAFGAHRMISVDFAALCVAGTVALAAVAALFLRMRGTLHGLRALGTPALEGADA
ncbi:lipopolysaccharide biosynthesis protein [Actinomadura macrotermitis]|uniref:Lipopolysaccharide biosynthesis protein WzxC n=1 Tax=Actinomadura macrotermitis TaxID=2585200 RepID=A0A7K0BRE8_9ACTN|nr:lipopolysaccharide biosynthesis protein [Actinomadura macrotermitis]MQY03472.1 Lipopolysaccharide biosynthesis protein WzxC [Actinomadura macrotermitis]